MAQSQNNHALPAGLLPEDCNIELFADPENFGKCYWLQYGHTRPFHELPIQVIVALYHELFIDRKAVKALNAMGITKDNEMLEHYNFCNRGKLDSTPDITTSGKLNKEFFDCGRRGQCPGEGKVCKLTLNGIKLTYRELQCLRYTVKGKDYKQIASEMGFNNTLPVNSLMSRLREKFGAGSKSALIIMSQQLGIF